MCGITGLLAPGVSPEERAALVGRMADRLVHRGPDGRGLEASSPCAFGFRRLAIVDLAAPSAPFATEDGSVLSIANAEIYNAPELRQELVARGHHFTTRIDTEVIPHLYQEHGADFAHRLDGMFALAIWDARRQRLLLARDRAGEKPLFYWHSGDELAFASELRGLLAHPRVRREIDPVALRRYLLHDFFPAPFTPFAGIRKLPPGHVLEARDGQVRLRRFWDLAEHFANPKLARRSTADLAAELDGRISRAVARRRRSDAPLGVFLSGGLDSTTLLSHAIDQAGPGVPAFTLGHTDPDFDESRFAADTARALGADLHTLTLGETDLAEGLRRVAEGFDEPLADASIIPVHLLSLFARQHVKVVLSGEGADELFAGYPTYLGHRLAAAYRRVPPPLRRGLVAASRMLPVAMGNVDLGYLLRRFATGAVRPLVDRHTRWFGSFPPELQDEVVSPELRAAWRGDDPLASAKDRLAGREWPDELSQALYLDFTTYLPDDLLVKVDRATMLASLEARAPFLDHELAEFVAGLPSKHKVSRLTTKALLRRAAAHRVPREVLKRRKRGFNIPFSRWLLHGLGEDLRQRFSPARIEARGLLSADGVGRLLDEHLARRADHRKPLFSLLALDLWCDRTWGEGAAVPVAGHRTEPEALAVAS